MDIERKDLAIAKRRRHIIYGVIGFVVVALVTVGVSQLKPAAPGVETSTLYMGTVERGTMLRQVRGTGTLVPEEFQWIPAMTEGRVEKIFVQPGEAVTADTVVLELSDPRQIQTGLDAEWRLRAAEADFESLRAQLEGQRLEQEASVVRLKAEWEQAKLRADADAELARQGLLADLNRKLSASQAEELGNRHQFELRRLEATGKSAEAQLSAQRATINQLEALNALQQGQVSALKVKAGIDGTLQEIRVEVGESVTPGAVLAKVVRLDRLKAELRIAETQAKDIQVGQVASIDTRNGVIPGRVRRVDPAAQSGSVTIDVSLEGALPRGARPDLTVDGTIELERLEDVLYVGRPVHATEGATIGLFKVVEEGSHAERVNVRVGRTSVSTIEILEGLQEGDQVVLSDMSTWDEYDRVKLK